MLRRACRVPCIFRLGRRASISTSMDPPRSAVCCSWLASTYRLTISSSGTGGLAGSADVTPRLNIPTSAAMKYGLKTLLTPHRGYTNPALDTTGLLYNVPAVLPKGNPKILLKYSLASYLGQGINSCLTTYPTQFRYAWARFGYDKTIPNPPATRRKVNNTVSCSIFSAFGLYSRGK